MHEVTLDVRHRIRELLNADQQKQYEELMKRVPRRPQGGTNGPSGFPGGPMPRGGPMSWRGQPGS